MVASTKFDYEIVTNFMGRKYRGSDIEFDIFQSKGPTWPVSLGRRDGRISIANETKQLPPPTANLTQLIQMFAVKGLDLKDLVVLSGNKYIIPKKFNIKIYAYIHHLFVLY